ncbi:Pre-mRNA-splicing factor SPF27 [Chytridium lagenaria]|nr:Pre-mRNA-splicing factor SPF27 [Chytridium lagenaria]
MALPYIDKEFEDERLQRYAEDAIREEMQRSKGIGPAAVDEFALFMTDELLKKEMERVSKGESISAIDTARFRLRMQVGQAVQNAFAQLEHKHNQMLNLELINKFGSNAWRIHNAQLDSVIAKLQQELEAQKQSVSDINKERKTDQMRVGFTLSALETRWGHLVDQCLRVDIACEMLEAEVASLR